jgi:hypothetical protein
MVLSPNEESLIKVVRMLPPDEASKVLVWAQQLADLGGDRSTDWSDSWSEDDLREATAASLERFEQQEREGR